jgi:hypothetical protein
VVAEVPTTPEPSSTFLLMVLLPARLVVETTPRLRLRVEPPRPARTVKVMLVDEVTTKAHGLRVVVVVPVVPVATRQLRQRVPVELVPRLAGLPRQPKPHFL